MGKHPDILTAINAVMTDLPAVGKDGKNSAQGFNFRGIDGVLNACGPVLRKHGVIAAPRALQHIKEELPRRGGGSMTHVLIELEVTWLLAGTPVDSGLRTVVWGEAFDISDKATAKAHSVALRTAYIQTLALPTQEKDPDEDYYERGDEQERREEERKREINAAFRALTDIEKSMDFGRIEKAVSYYSSRGDSELTLMATSTRERMQKAQERKAQSVSEDGAVSSDPANG